MSRYFISAPSSCDGLPFRSPCTLPGRAGSGSDLRRAAVAAAQRALKVALVVDRGVLAGEVQIAVPSALDPVEGGVLAGPEIGAGAACGRVARGPGIEGPAGERGLRAGEVRLEVVDEVGRHLGRSRARVGPQPVAPAQVGADRAA